VNSRPRHFTLLLTLVALLLAAMPALAHASPDGDDDPTYNAGGTFGTQYSPIGDGTLLENPRPVTDQDSDGSSVTAVVIGRDSSESPYLIRLTRFDVNGQPAGFGGDGISEEPIPSGDAIDELLDIRILSDGTFWVLARGSRDGVGGDGEVLLRYLFTAAGVLDDNDASILPEPCQPEENGTRDLETQYEGFVVAARVKANGDVAALWDCVPENDYDWEDHRVFVTSYLPTSSLESASRELPDPVSYGNDLELGPTGDPYALVGIYADMEDRIVGAGTSQVFHVNADATLTLAAPVEGSHQLDGLPVDLAVDSQARPVVWTQPEIPFRADGNNHWNIWRLTPALALDTGWGTDGQAIVSDPRLAFAFGGSSQFEEKHNFLTVRPGDKVLATGGYLSQGPPPPPPPRASNSDSNGMIVGLTNGGQIDTGFATGGFKEFSYSSFNEFDRIGEPTLQSDGKVLIPATSGRILTRSSSNRIASPPGDGQFVGVTRLVGANPSGGSSSSVTPSVVQVRPSATPRICGRRAISLVRADVQGKRVKLTGLVGAALFGKTVTIQTDPKGAKSSKFTRTTAVKASKTGSFTAFVPKPKKANFVSIRYRAVSGTARSPVLKLPQRLTSRSVKSAAGTITVKGRVKKSVLGKRNRVKIRRLVCGRYRTVGTAKPDANGNYTVTFAATQIRGVAFYRAESMVLRKAGSKKYVIQYARAIAIRTTSQTG